VEEAAMTAELAGLRDALRARLCAKASLVEDSGVCVLLYCRRSDGPDLLIAASAEEHGWLYAKIVAEPLVKPYMWHCNDVFMMPYGLYSFARSVEGLVEKMLSKEKLVLAQYRLALQRLGAG